MSRTDDPLASIAAVLHEAAETHHVVYRLVDGDDVRCDAPVDDDQPGVRATVEAPVHQPERA